MPASSTPPDTARPTVDRAPSGFTPADSRLGTPLAGQVLPLRLARLRRTEAAARRALDVVVSALALAVLAPVFALVAVGIKLTSPGPVLYQQVRVGQDRRTETRGRREPSAPGDRRAAERRSHRAHGRPFRIFKFRTMAANAEEYGPQWSRKGDPRIFRLGRFLRLTRLDETPQFLNVLRGDMSLVGPRPERPYFVDQFAEAIPRYRDRLTVRPGITGRAQVSLDYDSNVDDVKRKLDADLAYIRNRSLRQDLAILVRTVWVVLTGRGAC
jgi:lipopolysaccharide/colanic/teichoic acid biosynthesis glycosyltransferase